MLLPLDTVMNVWFTAIPIFEWEPEPPPLPPTDACDAPDAAASDDGATPSTTNPAVPSGMPPAMRLVFRRYDWITTPVWTQRENPSWDLVQDNHRDEDQNRAMANAKPVARQALPDDAAPHDAIQPASDEPSAFTPDWPECPDWDHS
jgi:hypothetical protein